MQSFSRLVEPKAFRYDVFLSFRGIDTRFNFTGHLYKALCDLKVRTFMDDREIDKGTQTTKELPKAIEESRIFIIVLSENFASSSFCLKEVVDILKEFAKGKGRWVLPVFYLVDQSGLANTYEQALADQKEWYKDEKIEEWRTALSKLANFSGCRVIRGGDINESQCIDHVLEEVSRHVTYPIGLSHRVSEVNKLLRCGSDVQVHMVGICGDAGIGKTRVARGVYNFNADSEIHHYCFFDYVEETLSHSNVEEGMAILNRKKVFIIFQDIKDSEQLNNIIALAKQFGYGSKVIITARDKCLFNDNGIKSVYEVEKFSTAEAFELLALKAFNSRSFSAGYLSVLNDAVTYALGHPWTLEVIGSNLRGKSIEECKSALVKYKEIRDRDIQKILEESFNALEECQQRMLIHIALKLKEQELTVVEDELCSYFKMCPKKNVRVLLDKSLIKINEHGQVTLHASTHDMISDEIPRFLEYGTEEIQPVSNDGSMIGI